VEGAGGKAAVVMTTVIEGSAEASIISALNDNDVIMN